MTRVVAAAVQLSPVLHSRDGTIDKVCAAIEAAAKDGAELVVFPETVVPYYPYFSFVRPPVAMGAEHLELYEQSVSVPSPALDRVATAAKRAGAVVALGINERDHGSLYNAQVVFDADGTLVLHRRKLTPTFHERMLWGQGDGSGLVAVETRVGRVGALACWEHYNPLARYALMADHEQIHVSMFPGSLVGDIFRQQIEVTIRHHALESGCFVVNATGFLRDDQVRDISRGSGMERALSGGCFTAIVSPEGALLAEPLESGEGSVLAELDLSLIVKRKRMMDSVGHYSRPELLSLLVNRAPQPHARHVDPRRPADVPLRAPAPSTEPQTPDESRHDAVASPPRNRSPAAPLV